MQAKSRPIQSLNSYEKSLEQSELTWDAWYSQLNVDPAAQGWDKKVDDSLDSKIPGLHLKLYMVGKKDDPLLQTYSEAIIPNVDFDKFMKMRLAIEMRKSIDSKIMECKTIKKFSEVSDAYYMQYEMPTMVTNRDFVCDRHILNNKDHPELVKKYNLPVTDSPYTLVNIGSISLEEVPVKKGFVRGDFFATQLHTKEKDGSVKIIEITKSNPNGSIPRSVLNMMASSGMKKQVVDMYKQYQAAVKKGIL